MEAGRTGVRTCKLVVGLDVLKNGDAWFEVLRSEGLDNLPRVPLQSYLPQHAANRGGGKLGPDTNSELDALLQRLLYVVELSDPPVSLSEEQTYENLSGDELRGIIMWEERCQQIGSLTSAIGTAPGPAQDWEEDVTQDPGAKSLGLTKIVCVAPSVRLMHHGFNGPFVQISLRGISAREDE